MSRTDPTPDSAESPDERAAFSYTCPENLVEILDGLGSDDEVVMRPGGSLEDGGSVVASLVGLDGSRR